MLPEAGENEHSYVPISRTQRNVRSCAVFGDLCHPLGVAYLLDEVAAESPDAVYRSGGEIFVAADIAPHLVDRAEAAGIAILGLEGFLVDESTGAVFPSLARIADFSRTVEPDRHQFVSRTCAEARDTLAEWSDPPAAGDGMNVNACGRHMLAIVLDDDGWAAHNHADLLHSSIGSFIAQTG